MRVVVGSVRLSAGEMRYTESGRGPVIVFVHGVFVNGFLWRKVTPLLESSFRCIVPTLPLGAHESPLEAHADRTPLGIARLLVEFLEALDLREVTLVGNDTGGALCQLLIAHHPERVARVVLTNCDAFENFPPPVLRPLYAAARIPGFCWFLAQIFRWPLLQRAFFSTVASTAPPEPAMLDALFRPLRMSAGVRRDIAAFLMATAPHDLLQAAATLGAFRGAALIVWGTGDWFFSLRDAHRLVAAFGNATLIEIAGSRTFLPEDQPVVLAKSIESFLAAAPAA